MDDETFVIEMLNEVSGPAKAASSDLTALERSMNANAKAVNQLDAAMKSEGATLDKLKAQLASVNSGSEVNIAQYKKLVGAIERSEGKLQSLGNAMDRATEKGIQLGEKGAAAQAKYAAAVAATQAKIDNSQKEIAAIQKSTADSMAARQARINAGRAAFAQKGVAIETAATKKWLGAFESAENKKVVAASKAAAKAGKAEQAELMKTAKLKGKLGKLEDKNDDAAFAAAGAGAGIALAALAAATAIVAAGVAFAQSSQEFKANSIISFQAITKNAKQAEAAYSLVHDLAQDLPESEENLSKMAEALLKAGTPIDQIGAKIRKQVADSGKSFASISTVAAKFGDMMRGLFDGANPAVEEFNKGLGVALGFFKETSTTGQALRGIVTGIFDGIFKAATAALPFIREGLRQIIITILKVQIALIPAEAALRKAFGPDTAGKALSLFTSLLSTVGSFYVFMAKTWSLVIQFFVGWYNVLQPIWKVFGMIFDEVSALASLIGDSLSLQAKMVSDAFTAVYNAIASLFTGGEGLATSLIDGIVAGLTGGASKVVNALTSVGKDALSSVKNVLGIASPSKEMAKLGAFTAEGFTQGIESKDPGAAIGAAVAPPSAISSPTNGNSGSAAAAPSINVELVVQFGGAPANQKEVLSGIEEGVIKIFENIAVQLGGALSSGPTPTGAS